MIDRPYRQDDPRGWASPSHWTSPRLPMWQSPEHISYPLLKVLKELYIKILNNQPDDFANAAS